MKHCAICGGDWEECGGECADWVTFEERVEFERRKEEEEQLNRFITEGPNLTEEGDR